MSNHGRHGLMRQCAAFIAHCSLYVVLLLVVRAVAVTICTIEGDGLQPLLAAGDRVMVNRWSYGLRAGDGDFFSYGRFWRQTVGKGDLVAFENPHDGQVLICRCRALPGDTVVYGGRRMAVPSLADCADSDYYWMEAVGTHNTTDSRQLGFIAERYIIGRAFMVVWSHEPGKPLWSGWRTDRMLMPL